jgi:hypothetical protein
VRYVAGEPDLDLVGTDAGVKARMKRGENDIVATIAAACRRAVAADGTDLVLFGCTCMTPVAGEVAARTGLEILDPSTIGLRAALGGERFDAPAASRLGSVGALVDPHLSTVDDCGVCTVLPTAGRAACTPLCLRVGVDLVFPAKTAGGPRHAHSGDPPRLRRRPGRRTRYPHRRSDPGHVRLGGMPTEMDHLMTHAHAYALWEVA